MEKNIIDILELNKIKDEVKKYAATNVGSEVIEKLTPMADYQYIKRSLAEVTAGKKILEEFGLPPFGGIRDLRETIKKVTKEIVLSGKELLDVRTTIGAFKSLKIFFNEIVANLDPRLIENLLAVVTDEGNKITPLPGLERELDHCLDEYGEVRDRASNRLASLRSEINTVGNRIKDKMDSIVRGNRYKDMLQDNLITRRGDRYVVPIKHEYRNIFSGIVHDQSASGMTLFMEPLAIVKMNNRLRELKRKEEEEVYRILQRLTSLIAEEHYYIKENLKISSFLDLVFARAEYSRMIGGLAPEINQEGMIRIVQGRHPLLKDDAVPIDINVGEDFTTLVITGPNTGGKTVALKTVGLFVLMVKTGLHIPAHTGTDIAIFQNVFADIGDEQSIEQNLSTFSSHITRIRSFLKQADQHSLVLMDELGAGTDPREGAALGIAILEKLRERRVITVATTHYSQLKSYAYTNQGVENASVEFDLETLQPTYRLLMGIPGGSNAFEIAFRLGIPADIIKEARKLISSKEIEIEEIIAGLNSERKRYQELRESFEKKERLTAELEEKYKRLLAELNDEKVSVIGRARQEAEGIIGGARKEAKEIIQGLKKEDFTNRPDIDRTAQQLNERFKEMEEGLSHYEEVEEEGSNEEIMVGDQVRFKSIGRKGEVLEIDQDKGEAVIRAGIMTIQASLNDLVKAEEPDEKRDELVKRYRVKKAERVSAKLDLRGERYEVAQQRLDKYLDDAFLAKLKQVEIIHGKGTGALRGAVKDILEENPHVSSFRMGRQEEGGSGVTIAEINY